MSNSITNRRTVSIAVAMALLCLLSACKAGGNTEGIAMKSDVGQQKERQYIVLNIVAFNYYDRSIFDIYLSGHSASGALSAFGGAKGIVAGVHLPLGKQTLTWVLDGPEGMIRNGETVTTKSNLLIERSQIPNGTRYLGLHIYPDETAEITYADGPPSMTPRGRKLYDERKRNGN